MGKEKECTLTAEAKYRESATEVYELATLLFQLGFELGETLKVIQNSPDTTNCTQRTTWGLTARLIQFDDKLHGTEDLDEIIPFFI